MDPVVRKLLSDAAVVLGDVRRALLPTAPRPAVRVPVTVVRPPPPR